MVGCKIAIEDAPNLGGGVPSMLNPNELKCEMMTKATAFLHQGWCQSDFWCLMAGLLRMFKGEALLSIFVPM